MSTCFLDTNILLRFLTGDDKQKAQKALNLFMRIERGEEKVITSSSVIFEAVFTLQKMYKLSREEIRDKILPIISLRGVHLADKGLYYRAFDIYVNKNVSFVDAYNAAFMISEEIFNIYSWDTGFDKIEGIVRLEPEEG
ncbi:MAG TPA: PIN domain-containing protein [Ktedonobacteraceae bacterium]|jgi:predicted nucleic acid-binding protein|nr:PIN domain-containing protein [Ktedonobacteraceae bacterium]